MLFGLKDFLPSQTFKGLTHYITNREVEMKEELKAYFKMMLHFIQRYPMVVFALLGLVYRPGIFPHIMPV